MIFYADNDRWLWFTLFTCVSSGRSRNSYPFFGADIIIELVGTACPTGNIEPEVGVVIAPQPPTDQRAAPCINEAWVEPDPEQWWGGVVPS